MLHTTKTIVLAAVFSLLNINLGAAQITPDNTLGSENSTVREGNINGLPSDIIENGATRGTNLFHSFKEFNVQENRGAYFNHDSSINNVLTRVTGGNVSNIMGTLGVIGNANLFLLNPHGIVFGPNAKLDVNGSFLGSNSEGIKLGENGLFNAINPQESNLLNIPPSVFFKNALRDYTGAISVNSNLTVKPSQNLTLIGDEISVNNSDLTAEGGIINLITLQQGDFNLKDFTVSENAIQGTINITNNSSINAWSKQVINGGQININTASFNLNRSTLDVSGYEEANSGSILIKATDSITLDRGKLYNNLNGKKDENIILNGGNITLETNTLTTKNSSLDATLISGKGNTGDINLTAENMSFNNTSILSRNSINSLGGNTGNINIFTKNAEFINGSNINTQISSQGNSGDVNIIAPHGQIIFDSQSSGILSNVPKGLGDTEGNSGNITIETGILELKNGATISAENSSQKGDTGSINIITTELLKLDGDGSDIRNVRGSIGNSQDINIIAGSLLMIVGSSISSELTGQGQGGNINLNISNDIILDQGTISTSLIQPFSLNIEPINTIAGNINVTAKSLQIINRSGFSSETLGQGDAGNITMNIDNITIQGNLNSPFPAISSEVLFSNGEGGNITINTNNFTMTDHRLSAATLGEGNGGDIIINARENIKINNNLIIPIFNGIFTNVKSNAIGNGGQVILNTPNLFLQGTVINAETSGQGNAGNISIPNSHTISLNNSGILTLVNAGAIGTAGNIEIDTQNLILDNVSLITTLTNGEGKAGDLIINSSESVNIFGQSILSAQTNSNFNAGNIIINSPQFFIDSGSQVSAFTNNSGNAGNITINSPEFVDIGKNSKINVETSDAGSPGNINITTENLNIGENAQLSATATVTSTNTAGGGSINLDVNNLNISGKLGIFAETNSATPAGNLTIKPLNPDININFTENGFISASTKAKGDGGNITITAPESIDIQGLGKISVETSGAGNAGNINLESKNLNINNQTEISASTTGAGKAGSININVENLNLTGNAKIISDTFSSGDSGNININVKDNLTLNDSKIAASTAENSTGNGGSIFIDPNLVNLTNSTIAVSSQGLGTGGNIGLTANTLNLDHSAISAETNSTDGGSIELNIANNLNLRNASEITATAGKIQDAGNGGNINLNADFIINYPDNNKITANAYKGNGGNINITSNGILGPQYLDITASSELGLQGNIDLNIPKTDPASGLVQTEKPSIDIAALFAKDFCKLAQNSSFVFIGRGGKVVTLEDNTDVETGLINWVDNPYSNNNNTIRGDRPLSPPTTEKTPEITEIRQAQGWVKLPDGTIVLTAHPVEVTPMGVKFLLRNCN